LAENYVRGLQGSDPRYVEAVAGCKHFSVFGGPGNRARPNVSESDWRTTFLPQFKRCVDQGSWSLMCSYSVINGVPACANSHQLTDILRKEWHFQGYIVSDQGALEQVASNNKVSNVVAASQAVNAGCSLEDGNSEDNVFSQLVQSVQQGLVSNETINDAVSRLFMARMHLGEFDPKDMVLYKSLNLSLVDSPAHRKLAQDTATKTFVLLKNENNILPINLSNVKTIAVMGPQANSSSTMFGDYAGTPNIKITPLQGIQAAAQKTSIIFTEGCDIACTKYDKTGVISTANKADIVLLFMGISTAQEAEGRDRTELSLPGEQMQMIQDAQSTGKPVVLVLLTCGPLDVNWPQQNVPAILEAFYPAQATGSALADVLFGKVSPAGRLPVTWPASMDQVPPMELYTMDGRTYRYWTWKTPPLYPFGYGLSYTSFLYSDLSLSTHSLKPCDSLDIHVTVLNTGTVASDEVVQVYISWQTASSAPLRQLVSFDRITVEVSQKITASFTIQPTELALWLDEATGFVLEPGTFTISVGGQQPDQAVKVPSNVLKDTFTIVGQRTPLSTC